MSLIAVNLTASVFEEIKAFVEKGLYTSPEQFLEIAAFNQISLERGSKPADVIARGHRQAEPEAEPSSRSSRRIVGQRAKAERGRSAPVGSRSNRAHEVSEAEVEEIFKRLSATRCSDVEPVPLPAMSRPPNERLWGQVNRLFPIKFACRWISVTSAGKPNWERLGTIANRMVEDAVILGTALEKIDFASKRKRDDLLSTGFPKRGNIASRDRFLSQFIARMTRAHEIYPGAICQYALAEFDGDQLALTDRGLAMARLENPILDSDWHRAGMPLSSDERSFFIQQILQYVPGELHDLRVVLRAITSGRVTPDDLLKTVRPEFPREWSDMMTRTHVSGLVARLIEIALLRRRWEGRNARYETTSESSKLFAEEVATSG